jgi:hypothetical protein
MLRSGWELAFRSYDPHQMGRIGRHAKTNDEINVAKVVVGTVHLSTTFRSQFASSGPFFKENANHGSRIPVLQSSRAKNGISISLGDLFGHREPFRVDLGLIFARRLELGRVVFSPHVRFSFAFHSCLRPTTES